MSDSEKMTISSEPAKVEAALRAFIASVDYDLHKQLECDEEDGTNHYPGLAANFIAHMEATK